MVSTVEASIQAHQLHHQLKLITPQAGVPDPPRPSSSSSSISSSLSSPPLQLDSLWPPCDVSIEIHPDDRSDQLLMAICAALVSVDNRALCPKEIADVVFKNHWAIPPSTQPFGAVSASIRNHLRRSKAAHPPVLPLLAFYSLVSAPSRAEERCMGLTPEARPSVKRSTLWFLNPASTGASDPFEGVPEKGVKRKPIPPPVSAPVFVPPPPPAPSPSPPARVLDDQPPKVTGMKIKLKWNPTGATTHPPEPAQSPSPTTREPNSLASRPPNLRVNLKLNPTRSSLTPDGGDCKPSPSELAGSSLVTQPDSSSDSEDSEKSDVSDELESLLEGFIRPTHLHRRRPKAALRSGCCWSRRPDIATAPTQRLSSIFSTFYPTTYASCEKVEPYTPCANKVEPETEEDGMLVDHELWPSLKHARAARNAVAVVAAVDEELPEVEEEEEEEDDDERSSASGDDEPEDYAEMMVSRSSDEADADWERWRERSRSSLGGGDDSMVSTPRSPLSSCLLPHVPYLASRRLSAADAPRLAKTEDDEDKDQGRRFMSRRASAGHELLMGRGATARSGTKPGKWAGEMRFGPRAHDLDVTLLEEDDDEIMGVHHPSAQNVDQPDLTPSEPSAAAPGEKAQPLGTGSDEDGPENATMDLDCSTLTEPITLIEQVPSLFDDLNDEPVIVDHPPRGHFTPDPTRATQLSHPAILASTRSECVAGSSRTLITSLADKLGFTSLCETREESHDPEESGAESDESLVHSFTGSSIWDCRPVLSAGEEEEPELEGRRRKALGRLGGRSSKRIKLKLEQAAIESPPTPPTEWEEERGAVSEAEIGSDEEEPVVVVDGPETIQLEELDQVWGEPSASTSAGLTKECTSEFLTSASTPKTFVVEDEGRMGVGRMGGLGAVYVLRLQIDHRRRKWRRQDVEMSDEWVLIRRVGTDLVHLSSLRGILKSVPEQSEEGEEEEGVEWIGLSEAMKLVDRYGIDEDLVLGDESSLAPGVARGLVERFLGSNVLGGG